MAAVSNLQIIEELCGICDAQVRIIRAQAAALEQLGAVVMEEERVEADQRMTALLGRGEAPDCFAD